MKDRRVNSLRPEVSKRADGAPVLSGYAAVYYNPDDPGTEYELCDGVCERIMPGCFSTAIQANSDVRCLANHDSDALLGRTASGTLRLSTDGRGLKYECDVAPTSDGKDVMMLVERGDISGSSFAFIPTRVSWTETPDCLIRQIEDCELYDVGPVTFPAYESTTAAMRSAEAVEEIKREAREWKAGKQSPAVAESIRIHLRLMELE